MRQSIGNPRFPGGFTLIELMLVVAIMAVISAIAAPRLANSLRQSRLNAAAQRVAADLNMVRARANLTSSPLTITYTFATAKYQVPGVVDLNKPSSSTYTVNLADEPYKAVIASTNFGGASLTSGTSQISFDAFGTPSAAGSIAVGVSGSTKVISIDAGSGMARVQ